jgi:hypothetical protein
VEGVPHGELPLSRPPGVRPKLVHFTTGAGDRSAMLYVKGEAPLGEPEPEAPPPPPEDDDPEPHEPLGG